MEEKKAYMWSFVESKKSFTGSRCMQTAFCRGDYHKFLTCPLTKRLSHVSILKWPLKHLYMCFKQSTEVMKPQVETRGSVRCFKCSASVFFYLGFLSQTFRINRTTREGGGNFHKSSLPLPTSSKTLRLQRDSYCRDLTFVIPTTNSQFYLDFILRFQCESC